MKKTKLKAYLFGLLGLWVAGFMLTGCSKDNPIPPPGGIDVAVGTFKGTLKVYPPGSTGLTTLMRLLN